MVFMVQRTYPPTAKVNQVDDYHAGADPTGGWKTQILPKQNPGSKPKGDIRVLDDI
jgi:hypothetical protein